MNPKLLLCSKSQGGIVCEGSGQDFDGINQYATIDDPLDELGIAGRIGNYYALSATVTLDVLQDRVYILGKDNITQGANSGFFVLNVDSGDSVYLYIVDDSNAKNISIFPKADLPPYPRKFHFLMQYNDLTNNLSCYVDGLLKDSRTVGTYSANISEFQLGADRGTRPFDGQIKDVRIFHKDVVADLQKLIDGKEVGGEVAWWCLSNSNFNDITDNGYDLTPVNIP